MGRGMSRQFVFNWKVTLFALICLVAFVNLGLWQLAREAEKTVLIEERNRLASAPAIAAADAPLSLEAAGVKVRLSGRFDTERVLLLDNRVLEGQVGFEVAQLLADQSGRVFLVNRGFVPMARTRSEMPEIPPIPAAATSFVARIYVPDSDPFELGDAWQTDNSGYPRIVQQLNVERLQGMLKTPLYPYVVRLLEGEPGALPRYWPDTVMQPEQHRGYAVQWFTMALAVVIAWAAFSFRKPKIDEE